MLTVSDIPLTTQEFRLLRELVYRQTGISLRESKLALLKARLLKRLRHYGCDSFSQYYELLQTQDRSGLELQEMINAVTTNKTYFFREPHHFQCLEKMVLERAKRLAAAGRQPSLRFWSAGCSSGEEAYSIAITIADALIPLSRWDAKVLATDIDTEMLERGRLAIYPREGTAELPRRLLERYFLRGRGRYADYIRVKPELRNLVSFGRINLAEEPWPLRGRFDAIFCRNVIIYFDRQTQQAVLQRLARCLKAGGILFSGHSENLFWLGELFQSVGNTAYQVRNTSAA